MLAPYKSEMDQGANMPSPTKTSSTTTNEESPESPDNGPQVKTPTMIDKELEEAAARRFRKKTPAMIDKELEEAAAVYLQRQMAARSRTE